MASTQPTRNDIAQLCRYLRYFCIPRKTVFTRTYVYLHVATRRTFTVLFIILNIKPHTLNKMQDKKPHTFRGLKV